MSRFDGPVLVTGAAGFIGSHLVEKLLSEDVKVRAFVRYNSRNHYGYLESLRESENLEIVTGDIRDGGTVATAVFGCSCVFHLAASIGIPYSYKSPADVVSTNVIGTQNILDAARAFKTPRVVVTSTSEVYGTPKYVPIDEKHPLQAQSPYAATKIAADKLAESYHNSFDVPVAVVRPFNTFGPRQSARAIIPTIISQALISDVIRVGNLLPTRDFMFVKDTVNAFITAGTASQAIGKVFNFGSGVDVSIGELIEMILSIVGKKVEVREDSQRLRPDKSEVSRLQCNFTQAEHALSWNPQYTLESGLVSTVEWIRSNLHLFKPEQYNV